MSLVANDQYDLKEGLYVDNLIHIEQSEDELIQFFSVSSDIYEKAHLFLKEWISNSSKLQTLVTLKGLLEKLRTSTKC